MKKISFLLLILGCVITIITTAQSPFTPGNIVLVRVGDGTTALGDVSAPVFLEEYTSAGTFVQSIPLPTSSSGANKSFVLDAGQANTGWLIRSGDGRYLTMHGYNSPVGVSRSSLNLNAERSIARIDYSALMNTSTSISSSATGVVPISVVSNNGTDFWLVDNSGVYYTTLGSSSDPTTIHTTVARRVPGIFNNTLYVSGSGGTIVTYSGLPTSAQASTTLPGTTVGAVAGYHQDIFLDLDPTVPGLDVIYECNEQMGIKKWSLVGGTWVSNGIIGVNADDYRGLAVDVNGTSVTLFCTRKGGTEGTSGGELVKVTDNTGYNSAAGLFDALPVTILVTAGANTVIRGVAMAPTPLALHVSVKAYLQGAYSTALGMHKAVTANWAAALNSGGLTQPYNTPSFGNYAGSETETAGFFAANAATTDPVDWVLVELRDATTPTTIIARRAALIREDGMVVDTDGSPDIIFNGVTQGPGNYYITIKHRNHLSIRSAAPIAVGTGAATTYDFTTSQSQAYQDPAITTNSAMKDLTGTGVFGMWAGNANSNTTVRSSGGTSTLNDFLYLNNVALGGNVATILGPPSTSPVYNNADLNMDGSVRASGGSSTINDLLYLWNVALGGNVSTILTAHQ